MFGFYALAFTHTALNAGLMALAFGMAISLEGILKVKDRTRWDTRKPGVAEAMRGFWKHMQALANPDLQFVSWGDNSGADKVVADAACKLHFLWLQKPSASTTNAWFKGSNHATVAAANGDVVVFCVGTSGGGREYGLMFGDGLPLGTGLTVQTHTTVNGNTKSNSADQVNGFAIIGAP
jgi:hypothetical protein